MSVMSRITGVFLSPVKTMQDIAAAPSWIVPVVIGAIASLSATAIVLPLIDYETLIASKMEEAGQKVDEAQLQNIVQISKTAGTIWGVVAGSCGILILSLIVALVLFAIVRLGGGETTYRKLFGVTAWSTLIQSLKTLISIVPLMGLETFNPEEMAGLVPSNPAAFVSRESVGGALYTLLSMIDIFAIWWLVVLGIGVAAASNWSRTKSALAVWIPYGVIGLLAVAWALATS